MPLIAGLGVAVALADAHRETEAIRFRELAAKLIAAVEATDLTFQLNGHPENRLPGNVSLSFPDIPREALFAAMADAGVAVSSGSACSSHDVAPSHVLTAMGVEAKLAQQTLRVGLGRSSTEGDIDAMVTAIQAAAERSR